MSEQPFTGNPYAPQVVVLDFETRSTLDLKKVGAVRYAMHPTTDVWCAAFAVDDGPVQLWVPGDPVPEALVTALANGAVFIAHNAGFERAILLYILTRRYGWPEIPIERWRCTMAAAQALALPPKLALVAKVLSLPEQKADTKIVAVMSKPRLPRGDEDPAGTYWFDDLERRQALYAYCRQDVETERALDQWLLPLSAAEQQLWCLDQVVNDRGFYTDGGLIEKAISLTMAAERAIQDELQQITGGEIGTTNQRNKLLAWLAARGCELEDLQKATVARALRRTNLSPEVRRVIELRQEAAHASKMSTLRAWRPVDGRVRGAFKYHGAATGRWSAGGPQPQNFRRESENTEAKLVAVRTDSLEEVQRLGAPIEIVSDIARTTICAPPGQRLLIGDFSGIESRVLAWIAGQDDKVEQWAKFDQTQDPNDDPYVVIGRALGHPETNARPNGKIADLAFGYQGGAGAYKNFAPEDDTASKEQIDSFKWAWRQRHPQIEQFWGDIDQAAINAVRRSPAPVHYGRLTLHCERVADAAFLFITLPSGRRLAYPYAKLITNDRNFPAVSFMDNALGFWRECGWQRGRTGAYGGMWTENIVSGIGRDLLAGAMTRLEKAGYPVVLHVHDELVCELPNNEGSLGEFKYLIERLPDWAKGLPVAAKVRNGPRFAEVDVPVEHVDGVIDAAAARAKAQRQPKTTLLTGTAEPLPIDLDMVARTVAFAIEREALRIRKEAGHASHE
jgi:DNA polymerase